MHECQSRSSVAPFFTSRRAFLRLRPRSFPPPLDPINTRFRMRIPRTTISISVPFLLLTALASVELLWNANSAKGTGLMPQVNELCSPPLSANSTLGQEAEYGASSEQASTEVVCKLTTIFVPMIEVSGIPSFCPRASALFPCLPSFAPQD